MAHLRCEFQRLKGCRTPAGHGRPARLKVTAFPAGTQDRFVVLLTETSYGLAKRPLPSWLPFLNSCVPSRHRVAPAATFRTGRYAAPPRYFDADGDMAR